MRAWKVLGLAGLAGVAATGAVLARGERQRRAYSPDDVRTRLHQRHAELAERPEPGPGTAADGAASLPPAELAAGRRHRLARLLRARRRP